VCKSAFWPVAFAADGYQPVVGHDADDGHLVGGKCAGFVRADDVGAAQGLHGGQAADQDMAADHALHTKRQGNRDDGRQTFRHGGNGQADGGHEQLDQGILVGAHRQPGAYIIDGVGHSQTQQADGEDHRADNQRGRAQPAAELVQTLLQRRIRLVVALEHFGDAADLRLHAGGDDQPAPAPIGDHAAHEGHVAPVAQGCIRRQDVRRPLLHRHRFPGQRRLVDGQVEAFDKSHVSRDVVAGVQKDDVPGDNLPAGDDPDPAFSHNMSLRRSHLLEGAQGRFRAALLDDTQYRIQGDDGNDGQSVYIAFTGVGADDCGDDRRHDQQDDDKAVELLPEHLQEGRRRLLPQLVRPVLDQALAGLVLGQTAGGVACQAFGCLGD